MKRGTINKETLRKTAETSTNFDNGGNLPTIVSNCQPEYWENQLEMLKED